MARIGVWKGLAPSPSFLQHHRLHQIHRIFTHPPSTNEDIKGFTGVTQDKREVAFSHWVFTSTSSADERWSITHSRTHALAARVI
jgi:hypothetical protein